MLVANIFDIAIEKRASDIHLRTGLQPILRIDGRLTRLADQPVLTHDDVMQIFDQITNPDQKKTFFTKKELDFAYTHGTRARFRINVMWQQKTLSIACRHLPFVIPSIDELELPQVCKELIMQPRGLILVTGPTGVGKSTTMAAMIRHLNEHRDCNVICIEDPIEYQHQNIQSIIAQREVGDDTDSFHAALVRAMRHDPDVLVVGEMRDLDTISAAITAAETGHLVMSTLHTADAVQTIDRIIDVFPPAQQSQIRLQLSQELIAILSQTLLPRASGKGQIAVFEIVLPNTSIRTLIREGREHEIPTYMKIHADANVQTLDDALVFMVHTNKITRDAAMRKSSDPKRLLKML
ncbi:MAG TPA: PilT/PilU family type 4a pilus ATPase, partial [Dehalococcoidales bacterium]|nr:PilT/PilU family type 4a pilus ATPase [Dehalococcoidales bacterium]